MAAANGSRFRSTLPGIALEDWHEVCWPSGAGGHKMYAHVVHTWIRKLGPTLLLITRHSLDEPLKQARFWGSTVIDLDAQALADILVVRWEIETCFEYEKDLLGSDHYQVMTAQAILRFWTLTACLMYFLEEQRAELGGPHATCGDASRSIQEEHRVNLLRWLEAQLQAGCTANRCAANWLYEVLKVQVVYYEREANMNITIHILNVVALTEDLPQRGLYRGQVGTVIEELAPDVFEVEFSDNNGRAYATLALRTEQLMVLHYQPVEMARSPSS